MSAVMDEKIGLERGLVRLAPHQPRWKQVFEKAKTDILQAAARAVRERYIVYDHEIIADIQHIGSTAVPGICAKPIIDIGLAVTRFEEGYALVKPLEGIGYAYRGESGMPGKHYFDYYGGELCTLHLHVSELGSPVWRDHILFRDYLLRHPDTAVQYEQLKLELAEKYRTERENYIEGKSDFIRRVLALARAEEAGQPEQGAVTIRYTDRLEGIDAGMLRGFFAGWPHPPTPETFLRLLRSSDAVWLAIDDEAGRVAGFISALTDHVLTAFIPLLEVLPEYRRRGIGHQLVKKMTDSLNHLYSLDLVCDEDLVGFYAGMGFKPGRAMMRRNYGKQGGAG